jgi:hypothetical protein
MSMHCSREKDSPDKVLGVHDRMHWLRAGEKGLPCLSERNALPAADVTHVHDVWL